MARQSGILRLSGTLGGLTFYRLNGQYYVRSKSSLDKKRVLGDPAFARSRECSRRFGQASQIAKYVYQHLEARKKRLYTIGRLLRAGHTVRETGAMLAGRYLGPSAVALLAQARMVKSPLLPPAVSFLYTAQPLLLPACPWGMPPPGPS